MHVISRIFDNKLCSKVMGMWRTWISSRRALYAHQPLLR